jgi:pimeloyl-ACP methyl ester carboxylesterase
MKKIDLGQKIGLVANGGVIASLILALACSLATVPHVSLAQVTFEEDGGMLPDGTPYLMRVPSNWTGAVIRDLDYATYARSDDRSRNRSYLLEKGYAMIGTGRHRLRAIRHDPAVEIANLDAVLEMFDRRFRRPDRVIQFGCSGGGAVTLSIAENYASRVDGAVAMAANIPVWQMILFSTDGLPLKH